MEKEKYRHLKKEYSDLRELILKMCKEYHNDYDLGNKIRSISGYMEKEIAEEINFLENVGMYYEYLKDQKN